MSIQNQIKRTYIRFRPNTPVEVTLDHAPDRAKPKDDEWQYVVNSNSALMYVPSSAHAQLQRTHAQAGDTVRIICFGTGAQSTFRVEVLSDAAAPEPEPEPVRRQPAAVQAMPRGSGSNYQHTANAYAAAPEPPQPQQGGTLVDLMGTCFVFAARALKQAHSKITQDPEWKDLEPPTWEDIRSTATSLFIERNRREGAR